MIKIDFKDLGKFIKRVEDTVNDRRGNIARAVNEAAARHERQEKLLKMIQKRDGGGSRKKSRSADRRSAERLQRAIDRAAAKAIEKELS